jgi:dTDP-4-dehydrorhamnose reductase
MSAYAAAVAARYPWVEEYTPVNEPLTTARFSGLYGHWYPHRRDDLSFSRMLLNQCRAVVLCMRAIRQVNSSARLFQTEDVGKVFSTPKLAYQAEFENERRWCTYDILSGRLNRFHRMWQHFIWAGVDESELQWFLDNPCPPAVIGLNHYLSGERYLDEHLELYPVNSHGGNGRERYADILAARVLESGATGPRALLSEAWERYHLPLAITECHNGCTREEQLRWFLEVWRGAERCRQEGADVRAVTAWSLLGSFDWNQLVTRDEGHYESGVYDVRFTYPRRTALAGMIRSLAAGHVAEQHPVLQVPGWWKRPQRFIYGIAIDKHGEARPKSTPYREGFTQGPLSGVRPVLISGGSGTLGQGFARICEVRGIPYRSLSRAQLDIADRESVQKALLLWNPWAIVNAAGYVRVDDAELHHIRCYRDNTEGPFVLATECNKHNIPLVTFSTDLVFGGAERRPYLETDSTNPMNYYGMTKAEAEQRVLRAMPSALVVRTSAFFGPWDDHNFVTTALRELRSGRQLIASADAIVSPTYVPDLVNACLDLLIDGERGVWHLANVGTISWAALAEKAAELAGVSTHTLRACSTRELKLRAKRPLYSVLGSERALILPTLEDALRRFVSGA